MMCLFQCILTHLQHINLLCQIVKTLFYNIWMTPSSHVTPQPCHTSVKSHPSHVTHQSNHTPAMSHISQITHQSCHTPSMFFTNHFTHPLRNTSDIKHCPGQNLSPHAIALSLRPILAALLCICSIKSLENQILFDNLIIIQQLLLLL